MKEPACLLGGWAVFISVNKRFNKDNGLNYLGSRDIDLGFHVDPNWSEQELQSSALAQYAKILQGRKFIGLGSRFVKHYDINTKEELTEDQSRKKQSYDMFQLYVDTMADNTHKDAQKILGFPLLDEPLLSRVFDGGEFISMKEFGVEFKLPTPEILVATKLKSVTYRTKDDKRTKDISDIYVLLWHSRQDLREIKQKVIDILGLEQITKVVKTFTDKDYAASSAANGVSKDEISRVINEMTT